ncbi:S1 family peptidase [Micromonospora sp. CB01531]|uniref:S1 family peptidase n=1 Tax=Micromonospora sp. CB01531 TaxID=1718947 RepID=UPI00093CC26A|nr:serine protease [Micromonospora sp. CB01531]OKI89259.1 hypothetical protein A6A27_00775 [Micromonospora sp. CB01531]
MQPVGPYRFTEAIGVCQVGTAWWAIDGQDRLVTVALLEGAAAADGPWREAFANAAKAMAQVAGGQRYVNADFAATHPWVAYPSEEGVGAQRLFQILGMELHHAEARDDILIPAAGTVATPPQPVSAAPVSPSPTSGAPQLPWAVHTVVPQQHTPEAVPTSPASSDAPVPRIAAAAPAPRRRGLWLGIAALAVLLVAAGGGLVAVAANFSTRPRDPLGDSVSSFSTTAPVAVGLKPWTQVTPYSAEERALATAAPALVFIEASFTGVLRNHATNVPVRTAPITFIRRCSGFLITPNGHMLTNSSCVRPPEEVARTLALDVIARQLVKEKKLAPGQLDGYIRTNLPTTVLTGAAVGSAPTVTLHGQLNEGEGNASGEQAIPGEVVEAVPAESGNLALVKLAGENLPAVELQPSAAFAAGASLLIVGYAASDTDSRNPVHMPRAKVVTITDISRRGSLSTYRTNGDVGRVSHGGIALDPSGRVVGMLDRDQARADGANRVVVSAAAFPELLGKAGVRNELGEVDRMYRTALGAYFSGRQDEAVAGLGTVADRSPANLLARAYQQNAVERRAVEGEPVDRAVWAVALLGGAVGAILVGLAVLAGMLRRRRPRR